MLLRVISGLCGCYLCWRDSRMVLGHSEAYGGFAGIFGLDQVD
jgi:hypothetical protein